MSVRINGQQRVVTTRLDGATGTFKVDRPFEINEVSESVNGVKYIFYRYQVEQVYDDATYANMQVYDVANTAYENPATADSFAPLHINKRTRWCTVTDQRPLRWTRTIANSKQVDVVAGAGVTAKRHVTAADADGLLIDPNAIAIGDRLKLVTTAGTSYETRTVDKIWGSGLDITKISVDDGYSAAHADKVAYVDESGRTDEISCSRRGVCQEDGTCECFDGYHGDDCSIQAALNA